MNSYKTILAGSKRLEIVYSDGGNPREDDNLSKMICFHNRYILGDEHNYSSDNYNGWEEMKEDIIKSEDVAIIVPLFLYDHSGITIRVGSFDGLLPQGHARFDSGQVGFAIVTKEAIKENFITKRVSKKQIEKAKEILLAEVETYDLYIRGECFGFQLFDENDDEINSCYGFLGSDFSKNGMDCYIEDEEIVKALLQEA